MNPDAVSEDVAELEAAEDDAEAVVVDVEKPVQSVKRKLKSYSEKNRNRQINATKYEHKLTFIP